MYKPSAMTMMAMTKAIVMKHGKTSQQFVNQQGNDANDAKQTG